MNKLAAALYELAKQNCQSYYDKLYSNFYESNNCETYLVAFEDLNDGDNIIIYQAIHFLDKDQISVNYIAIPVKLFESILSKQGDKKGA